MANVVEYILRLKDEVSAPLEDVEDAAEGADNATADLTKTVSGVGVAFVGAGVAIVGMTQELADYKNGIVDTSTRTGVAVDTIRGLQLAFEGSGQSAGAMEAFLAPLNKRLIDTARGTGEAQKGFDDLGISVVDSAGSLRSADDVLVETLAALQGIQDPTLRAAEAMAIFGEGGTKALQALGDTDLGQFVDMAEALGPAFRDGGAGAADFQRAMADLELASLGALDRIANSFDGENGVTGAIDAVTDGVVFMGVFIADTISGVVDLVRAQLKELLAAARSLANGDLSTAGAFLGGGGAIVRLAGLPGGVVDAAFAAAENATNARAQAQRLREVTRSTGGDGDGDDEDDGGRKGIRPGGGSGVDQDLISDLLIEFETDKANEIIAKQLEESGARWDAAIAQGELALERFTRATDTSLGALTLLGRGFQIAASSFGAAVTGDVAGAVGGAITGGAGLISAGLDLAAPAIGAAAGASIGSVALPGIGTVGGAAVGAAVTQLVPLIGDAIEGVAASIAQGIQQILEIGQIGAGGVAQRLDDFQRDFLKGLEVLPTVVADVLPEFAAEFGPALAEAAPVFAFEFTKALISAAPELWAAFLDAQATYARSSIAETTSFAGDVLGGARDNAQGLLQTATQTIGAGAAGSTIINVSGVVAENVDRLVDEMSSRLGSRGLNLQLGAR